MNSRPDPSAAPAAPSAAPAGLAREMGLAGLVATALSAMVGVGINIIPFMVHRAAPGVGGMVPWAYAVAAVPAVLAALCYAVLSSAMPRAGGSYVYATRGLDPFAGFLASFAQWFGLSMGMGVVAYLFVPMLRDTLATAGLSGTAVFDAGAVRVPLALAAIWTFWWVNRAGIRVYERTIVIMAVAMIVGPVIMTVVGFTHSPADFEAAVTAGLAPSPPPAAAPPFTAASFLATVVILFSSFIGFDAIAQAGGEAREPSTSLPQSIAIAIAVVAVYYIVFTASVYRAVPADYLYRLSRVSDVSAPALLAPLMPAWLGVVILVAVSIAILNSIPSVMLANSRLLFAFAADRVFPAALAAVHPAHRTPHHAITLTAVCGSASILGCHFAGDFFLGVDVLVLSMLVNFLLMAVTIVTLPRVNPPIASGVRFLTSRRTQLVVALASMAMLALLLVLQVVTDLGSAAPWLFKSTTLWLLVMGLGALVYRRSRRALTGEGLDPRRAIFARLPDE